jgi:hypothetical protein
VDAALAVTAGTKSFPPDQHGQIGTFVDPLVPIVTGSPNLSSAIATNARAQAAALAATSPIIKPAIDAGDLIVVAAVDQIASGRVQLP